MLGVKGLKNVFDFLGWGKYEVYVLLLGNDNVKRVKW